MRLTLRSLIIALVLPIFITGVLWVLRAEFTVANFSLIYLLCVVWVSIQQGIYASFITTVMSFLCFNFFLINPLYTFLIYDPREVLDLIIFFVIANVTGRLAFNARQQAEQIRQSKQIEEAEQLKTAILHAVSHDLRTPLTLIKTSVSNLLTVPLQESDRREALETIESEVDALNQMIGNLLDLSRLEAGALQMNWGLNSLEEVIGDVVGRIWKRKHQGNVRMEFPHDMPYVPFDYGLMLQALTNLIENALRYEPALSTIIIRGRFTTEEAFLDIINHGNTISTEEKPFLFKPFYHGKEKGGHVGLGLAIAKGILDAHGGNLWVSDTEGGGATFSLSLPRMERETA